MLALKARPAAASGSRTGGSLLKLLWSRMGATPSDTVPERHCAQTSHKVGPGHRPAQPSGHALARTAAAQPSHGCAAGAAGTHLSW